MNILTLFLGMLVGQEAWSWQEKFVEKQGDSVVEGVRQGSTTGDAIKGASLAWEQRDVKNSTGDLRAQESLTVEEAHVRKPQWDEKLKGWLKEHEDRKEKIRQGELWHEIHAPGKDALLSTQEERHQAQDGVSQEEHYSRVYAEILTS